MLGYHNVNNKQLYQNVQLQSGLMYFMSRDLYNILKNIHVYDGEFLNTIQNYTLKKLFTANSCSDAFITNLCEIFNLKVYTSKFSYIQHIGLQSKCNPKMKFSIRCANDFIQPFIYKQEF